MRLVFCLAIVFMITMPKISEATQLKIMFRYDDYSRYSNIEVEQALFEAAKYVGAGVLVGVIPFPETPYPSDILDEELVRVELSKQKIELLQKYVAEGVVHVAVHGYSHKRNADIAIKSEFTGLSEEKQISLLKKAKASLELVTKTSIHAFIPPFNQYDKQTLTALESNDYKLISSGFRGATLSSSDLTYLPGGPYFQKLKEVIVSAVSKGHLDAI
ncbi:MAG: DUF2334 domain-containing protein, partial [Methylomarinum sp.]|nr:DUF2334 domain-containing protein [Methylomarinum sp.]